jgi:hypothetical protein
MYVSLLDYSFGFLSTSLRRFKYFKRNNFFCKKLKHETYVKIEIEMTICINVIFFAKPKKNLNTFDVAHKENRIMQKLHKSTKESWILIDDSFSN